MENVPVDGLRNPTQFIVTQSEEQRILLDAMLERKVFINFWMVVSIGCAQAQFTNVELDDLGTVVGLKVFPESSVPVYAFLGIPYAKPPVNELRFAV